MAYVTTQATSMITTWRSAVSQPVAFGELSDRPAEHRAATAPMSDAGDGGRRARTDEPRDDRQQRADDEAHERQDRRLPWRRQLLGSTPNSSRACTARARLGSRITCAAAWAVSACIPWLSYIAASSFCSASLLASSSRRSTSSSRIDELVLGGDADPLAGRHADRAGDRTGDAGEADDAGVQPAAGEAEHEQDVRHQPVAHPEHRGSGQPAGHLPVTGMRLGSADGVAAHGQHAIGRRRSRPRRGASVQTWGFRQ